jgi:hypothetical protein
MELMVWGLELYARYAAVVLILGASVALAAWLSSAVASHRRPRSTREPSE